MADDAISYDKWGSDQTYNHMSIGWAWAVDTPFAWTKQIVSKFGGTRQGMAISWPKAITDKGGEFTWTQPLTDTPTEAHAGRREEADAGGAGQNGQRLTVSD